MLLRLCASLNESEKDLILRFCKDLGYEPRFLGSGSEILELEGEGQPEHRSRFEDHTCVREVLDPGAARELTARAPGQEDRVVKVGGARFGGGWVSLVAGPCAVEDEALLLDIARGVAASGASLLRGGAFKPRTSPYSFHGLGHRGLELLAVARAESGLPVVTEVLDPRDVGDVHELADMFQIGSRSMANSALLTEVGRTDKPVMLKRGMAATVREFLLAAEYILSAGNPNVVLCERGIRGFDRITRNVLDVGAIAYLKQHTHLPVIADPSHAAGRSDLVLPLARAGIAAGADGLLVEVHPAPLEVRSDGAQALSLEDFDRLARDVRSLLQIDGRRLAGASGDSDNGLLAPKGETKSPKELTA